MSVVADVTDFSQIEAARRRIEEQPGPIDILVANAGGELHAAGTARGDERGHASLDGNLTATFLTIKSVLPGMKARKTGCIITVSSADVAGGATMVR